MNYVIGTGFYTEKHLPFWRDYWLPNTEKYTAARKVYVINSSGISIISPGNYKWIHVDHNFGHVSRMKKNQKFGGWWLNFMAGAVLAYNDNKDFIYKEEDCLAFGNWVEELYKVDAPVVVGHKHHKYKVDQTVILVRHRQILGLIADYIKIPHPDWRLKPEQKFLKIMTDRPDFMKYTEMGFGSNRPFDLNKEAFYLQRITDRELMQLKERGLV